MPSLENAEKQKMCHQGACSNDPNRQLCSGHILEKLKHRPITLKKREINNLLDG